MTEQNPVEILFTVSFANDVIEQIHLLSPRIKVTVHPARRAEEIPEDVWNRVEVLYTDTVLPDPDSVPNLRWVQLHYAGVDYALEAPVMHTPNIMVTTLSGAAVPQMAEYILMMLLAMGHRMPEIISNRERADWPRDRWERFNPKELRDSTVGIVGYGSIGGEVARLLQNFGAKVLATKLDVMHPWDTGYRIEGLGDPDGNFFNRLYPIQALASMVKDCDFLVVCLPLTPETHHLINGDIIRSMKSNSYLIHVGRGGVVDQAALLSALQERRLAGAALDVFSEEPLPANSPLWRLPNTLVSPHIAGISARYKERAMALFSANLDRYLNDLPLYNLFNPEKKY